MIGRTLLSLILLTVLTAPFFSFAQSSNGLLRDGVLSCHAGAHGLDVATLTAIGGVYVPVNDAAVTLNTGYLVYKECVLDGATKKAAEAAASQIVRSALRWFNTADNGNSQFIRDQVAQRLEYSDKARAEALKQYNLQNMCNPYRNVVRRNSAAAYMKRTRDPNNSYSCTVAKEDVSKMRAMTENGDFASGSFKVFFDVILNPQNQVFFAQEYYEERARELERRALANFTEEALWGSGTLSVKKDVTSPTATGENRVHQEIITPGFLISNLVTQSAQSGFRQLENADEIDQIVGALFAGITSQILTNVNGLKGLTESQLGKAPYLDQLVAESNAGVRDAATGAGITVLTSALAVEQAYNKSKKDSKALLESAAAQLRRAEERCWDLLIPKVREYAQKVACSTSGDPPTTSCVQPAELRISTSTQRIKDGIIAVALDAGANIANGALYTMSIPETAIVKSGSVQIRASETKQFDEETNLGIPVAGGLTPGAGGSVTLAIGEEEPFSGGTLGFTLVSGKTLPLGEVRFALTPIPPFTQAAISLVVRIVQQFAEEIIEAKITPLLTGIEEQIERSNRGLSELEQIARDLQGSATVTAQRIALERLDALVGQDLLHSPYDVKDAEGQREALQGSMNLLVEDTVEEWSTGSGWCNIENEDVVRQWYERWRVQ